MSIRVCVSTRVRCTSSFIHAVVYMYPSVHMHKAIRAHSLWSPSVLLEHDSPVFPSLSFFRTPILLFWLALSPFYSLALSLVSPLLSFSQHCSSVYAKTHTSSASMHCFPILVIRTRLNINTPCRGSGVIERMFPPARARARVKYVRMKRVLQWSAISFFLVPLLFS